MAGPALPFESNDTVVSVSLIPTIFQMSTPSNPCVRVSCDGSHLLYSLRVWPGTSCQARNMNGSLDMFRSAKLGGSDALKYQHLSSVF